MAIPGSAHANLGLGSLVIAGGVVGYVRKGSKMSLLAGVTFGSILLGSGYMIAKTDNVYEGHLLAAGTSGLMAAAMGQRYMASGKFMPSGMVAALGVIACAYNIQKAREWAPSSGGKAGRSCQAYYFEMIRFDFAVRNVLSVCVAHHNGFPNSSLKMFSSQNKTNQHPSVCFSMRVRQGQIVLATNETSLLHGYR